MAVICSIKFKICERAFDMDITGFQKHEKPYIRWSYLHRG